MAPEERRAAIVAAAVELIRDRGHEVTTRDLADAAGVAEGTLFRVFPDKEALIRAAVEKALDPTAVLAQLAGIDSDLDLRSKLVQAVGYLQAHSGDVAILMVVSHKLGLGSRRHGWHGQHPKGEHPVAMVAQGIADLMGPHSDCLRLEPLVCARMLVGVVMATTHPLRSQAALALSPEQIVELFLDGAVDRSTPSEDPC
jgi:AcrR family transcriptional regulator